MTDSNVNRGAFEAQAVYCDANDAPITARLCRGIATAIDETTETGRRILGWAGAPILDALPLRAVGGIHALWRAGRAPELDGLFTARETGIDAISAALRITLATHDREIAGWLDGPPQTNEPGRSAALMAGLLCFADRFRLPFELLEIGSSAGLNLLIDRYRFDLGGVTAGPASSPVLIRPDWRGSPPPAGEVRIDSVRGVDLHPIDATDPQAEQRLLAYIWADHHIRFQRVAAGIAMQREKPVMLDQGDAADWVEARLAEPQASGRMRVLMHSIVWQYLPSVTQARIEAAMTAAGARATPQAPLGWISLEADRLLNRHDLVLRCWPGAGEAQRLGHAHAHGFWVEWTE